MKKRNENYIEKRDTKYGISYRVKLNGISKTFSTKDYGTSALPQAIRFRDKVLSETFIKNNYITVKDVFENIFEFFQLRFETQRKLRLIFENYIKDYEGIEVSKIKKYDVVDCLNKMVETCSNDTIQRVLSIWKKIATYSIYHEYIDKDFTFGIICPKSHKISKPKAIIKADKELLTKVEELCHAKLKSKLEREQFPLMLWTLYYTGMRVGEMLDLLKTDVDLKNNTISINKEIGSNQFENNIVRQCKTDTSVRIIPIASDLVPILDYAMTLTDSEKLFPTKYDSYYDSTLLGDKFYQLTRSVGLKFNLYAIRHYFSTSLVGNTDLRTIQELMGHKSSAMTLSYARSDDEKKVEAVSYIK